MKNLCRLALILVCLSMLWASLPVFAQLGGGGISMPGIGGGGGGLPGIGGGGIPGIGGLGSLPGVIPSFGSFFSLPGLSSGGSLTNVTPRTSEGDIRLNYLRSAPGASARNSTEPDMMEYPGSDVRDQNGTAIPGTINGSQLNAQMYALDPPIPASFLTYQVPAMEQMQEIQKAWIPTTGAELTDSAAQAQMAVAMNLTLAKLTDPQRLAPTAQAIAQSVVQNIGNGAAELARDNSASAIDFTSNYLNNFTVQANNKWNQVRDNIFVPMAILLLLPGAVLAQVRAIVAAGSPVLGDVNPFEGILRSMIAIFMIPGTYLVVNYGIDLSNSITYTISSEYTRVFGTDMYKDATCAEIRATPLRHPLENRNALDLPTASMTPLLNSASPMAQFEGKVMENMIEDPCAGLKQVPGDRVDEALPAASVIGRLMFNTTNAVSTCAWNVLCAFQMAYLFYLWCVGPIMAALWVWPVAQLRSAFPSWVEGVVTICFWSLFWNTAVLLMACFRGIDETGTVVMTAINFLTTASVQYAFDFAGIIKDAGQQATGMASGAQAAASGLMNQGQSNSGNSGNVGRSGVSSGKGGSSSSGSPSRSSGSAGGGGTPGVAGGAHGAAGSGGSGGTSSGAHAPGSTGGNSIGSALPTSTSLGDHLASSMPGGAASRGTTGGDTSPLTGLPPSAAGTAGGGGTGSGTTPMHSIDAPINMASTGAGASGPASAGGAQGALPHMSTGDSSGAISPVGVGGTSDPTGLSSASHGGVPGTSDPTGLGSNGHTGSMTDPTALTAHAGGADAPGVSGMPGQSGLSGESGMGAGGPAGLSLTSADAPPLTNNFMSNTDVNSPLSHTSMGGDNNSVFNTLAGAGALAPNGEPIAQGAGGSLGEASSTAPKDFSGLLGTDPTSTLTGGTMPPSLASTTSGDGNLGISGAFIAPPPLANDGTGAGSALSMGNGTGSGIAGGSMPNELQSIINGGVGSPTDGGMTPGAMALAGLGGNMADQAIANGQPIGPLGAAGIDGVTGVPGTSGTGGNDLLMSLSQPDGNSMMAAPGAIEAWSGASSGQNLPVIGTGSDSVGGVMNAPQNDLARGAGPESGAIAGGVPGNAVFQSQSADGSQAGPSYAGYSNVYNGDMAAPMASVSGGMPGQDSVGTGANTVPAQDLSYSYNSPSTNSIDQSVANYGGVVNNSMEYGAPAQSSGSYAPSYDFSPAGSSTLNYDSGAGQSPMPIGVTASTNSEYVSNPSTTYGAPDINQGGTAQYSSPSYNGDYSSNASYAGSSVDYSNVSNNNYAGANIDYSNGSSAANYGGGNVDYSNGSAAANYGGGNVDYSNGSSAANYGGGNLEYSNGSSAANYGGGNVEYSNGSSAANYGGANVDYSNVSSSNYAGPNSEYSTYSANYASSSSDGAQAMPSGNSYNGGDQTVTYNQSAGTGSSGNDYYPTYSSTANVSSSNDVYQTPAAGGYASSDTYGVASSGYSSGDGYVQGSAGSSYPSNDSYGVASSGYSSGDGYVQGSAGSSYPSNDSYAAMADTPTYDNSAYASGAAPQDSYNGGYSDGSYVASNANDGYGSTANGYVDASNGYGSSNDGYGQGYAGYGNDGYSMPSQVVAYGGGNTEYCSPAAEANIIQSAEHHHSNSERPHADDYSNTTATYGGTCADSSGGSNEVLNSWFSHQDESQVTNSSPAHVQAAQTQTPNNGHSMIEPAIAVAAHALNTRQQANNPHSINPSAHAPGGPGKLMGALGRAAQSSHVPASQQAPVQHAPIAEEGPRSIQGGLQDQMVYRGGVRNKKANQEEEQGFKNQLDQITHQHHQH
jgi:hypothetical protein